MTMKNCKRQLKSFCSDFIVRINGGKGPAIRGKIEHIQSGQVQYFNDFLELILLMQSKMDEYDYPQAETELRSFSGSINNAERF